MQSYYAMEGDERKSLPPSHFCPLPNCVFFLGSRFPLVWCNKSGFCPKYAQTGLVVHMAVTVAVWNHEDLTESWWLTVMGVF